MEKKLVTTFLEGEATPGVASWPVYEASGALTPAVTLQPRPTLSATLGKCDFLLHQKAPLYSCFLLKEVKNL